MRNLLILLFIAFICLPKITFGSGISITEIMYDAEGSDGGREWVEIYNSSGGDIDLTSYKFFENGTSHSISHLEGDVLLQNNSYAIIADNANNFINEYSGASKQHVYDASFSLSNSAGEYLALKDSDGNIINEITYDISIGAAGDGNSLQKDNSGSWKTAAPTILSGPTESSNTNNIQDNIIENTNTNNAGSSSGAVIKKESVMHFVFNIPKNVIAGNNTLFNAVLYGTYGEIINSGEFVWNFGDGTIKTTANLNEVDHVYLYPGDYTISVTYKYSWNPKPILVGRINILVIDSPFELTKFYTSPKYAVGITNKRDTEYNISGYIIKTNNGNINLPEATFIGGKDEIVFVLPQGVYDQNSISLLNPLGNVISSFAATDLNTENKVIPVLSIPQKYFNPVNVYEDVPPDTAVDYPANPKIIELEASAGSTNTNITAIILFVILILIGATTIFYIRSKKQKEDTGNAEDYALQDE